MLAHCCEAFIRLFGPDIKSIIPSVSVALGYGHLRGAPAVLLLLHDIIDDAADAYIQMGALPSAATIRTGERRC